MNKEFDFDLIEEALKKAFEDDPEMESLVCPFNIREIVYNGGKGRYKADGKRLALHMLHCPWCTMKVNEYTQEMVEAAKIIETREDRFHINIGDNEFLKWIKEITKEKAFPFRAMIHFYSDVFLKSLEEITRTFAFRMDMLFVQALVTAAPKRKINAAKVSFMYDGLEARLYEKSNGIQIVVEDCRDTDSIQVKILLILWKNDKLYEEEKIIWLDENDGQNPDGIVEFEDIHIDDIEGIQVSRL